MRYLSVAEVLVLHRLVLEQAGNQPAIRDLGALESAIAQPRQMFGGEDLHPTLAAKAAALGFSLIQNHAFVDGNKRVGHAAIDAFLRLNGSRLSASVDSAEQVIIRVASGELNRDGLQGWIESHLGRT